MSTLTWPDQADIKSNVPILKCHGRDHSKLISILLDSETSVCGCGVPDPNHDHVNSVWRAEP